MPGTAAGTVRLKHLTVASATSSTLACLEQPWPASTMFGFNRDPSRKTRCAISSGVLGTEDGSGYFLTALDVVVAGHEDFGFDDRDDPGLLRERGVACQGVGVGLNAHRSRNPLPNRDNRPPFREPGPQPGPLGQPVRETVQAAGHLLSWKSGQVDGAGIRLDAGYHPSIGEQLGQRSAIGRRLPHGLVIEDNTADELLHASGTKQQFTVRAPVILGRFQANTVKPLLDGPGAFVCRQNALSLRHQGLRRRRQLFLVHE